MGNRYLGRNSGRLRKKIERDYGFCQGTVSRFKHSPFPVHNSNDDEQTIGFVGVNIKESIPGLARLLPHYGKYSWLGFEGSRPDNVTKGTFPPMHSPLHYNIPVKGQRPVIKARLKPEPPLTTLPR